MTDNEIIKVLECCSKNILCGQCPLKEKNNCINKLSVYALKFINRQQTEIERLNAENILTMSERNAFRTSFYEVSKQLKHVKSGAIKKFAEKLKELYTDDSITNDYHCAVGAIKQNIDDIVKEMVGDAE